MIYPSPLRYPGGKNKLSGFMTEAVIKNGIQGGTYIEPFAGGAAIALNLLFMEHVNKIVINDIDKSIYSFWFSVIYETEKLCRLIVDTPINLDVWEEQKSIQNQKHSVDNLTLGFSTFYLNRTNYSGIIKGGVIGGKKQLGKWKMDARFNKKNLIKRIEKIALYEGRIKIYNEDAIDLINLLKPVLDSQTLIYFDPPYYNQGAKLYTNHFTQNDHKKLSEFILSLNCKWILTYDYTPNITKLYKRADKRLLTLGYTAARKTKGCEMIAFCDEFVVPTGKYSSITIE